MLNQGSNSLVQRESLRHHGVRPTQQTLTLSLSCLCQSYQIIHFSQMMGSLGGQESTQPVSVHPALLSDITHEPL